MVASPSRFRSCVNTIELDLGPFDGDANVEIRKIWVPSRNDIVEFGHEHGVAASVLACGRTMFNKVAKCGVHRCSDVGTFAAGSRLLRHGWLAVEKAP